MKHLFLMLALAGGLFAQSGLPSTATFSGGTGTGMIWSSGGVLTTPTSPYYTSANENCFTASGYLRACGGGPSYETRKDDGKGPTLLQVKSTARGLLTRELPPADYVPLAKSAGIDGPVIEQARMLEMIHNLELHVYDWKRVDEYLYRQALRQGTLVRWVWKPVRTPDIEKVAPMSLLTKEGVGMVDAKLYARPLPVRILKRIKEIECEMPDAVFLVSDYEVVKPDPFLAISTKSLLDAGKIWIVEQWQEPGFSEAEDGEVVARR